MKSPTCGAGGRSYLGDIILKLRAKRAQEQETNQRSAPKYSGIQGKLRLYTRYTTVVYNQYYGCIQGIQRLYTGHTTVVYKIYNGCIQDQLQ